MYCDFAVILRQKRCHQARFCHQASFSQRAKFCLLSQADREGVVQRDDG